MLELKHMEIQTAKDHTFPVLCSFSDFLSVRRTNLLLFELFMTEFSILAKLSDNKPLKNIAKADITTHLSIQIADVNCSHMLNYILH